MVSLTKLATVVLGAVAINAANNRDVQPRVGPHDLSKRAVNQAQVANTTAQTKDADCTNGPFTRACWTAGFNINADFDTKAPPAGVERPYTLEITNTTMSPDGIDRLVMAVNGQYPGPTLYADWGDTFVITVKNSLQDNGTSVHWHGIRQLDSNAMDGVNGLTECPIPPGSSRTYTFKCTQFGTSWYHSHHSIQYGSGVLGGIVINGPATANYDEDLGTLALADWYDEVTAFQINDIGLHASAPPVASNALINGTMKEPNNGPRGSYLRTQVDPGKKYRIRVINTAMNNHFQVSLDNHNFTVITSDFIPVQPYTTSSINIGVGQRHDLIISTDQPIANYWLRVHAASSCGGQANNGPDNDDNIKSIFSYSGAPDADPTTTRDTPKVEDCEDELTTPWVVNDVPQDQFEAALGQLDVNFNVDQTAVAGPTVQWLINGSAMDIDWEKPTLQYVLQGNTSYPPELNIYEITDTPNQWTFWILQNVVDAGDATLSHPIHLHGMFQRPVLLPR